MLRTNGCVFVVHWLLSHRIANKIMTPYRLVYLFWCSLPKMPTRYTTNRMGLGSLIFFFAPMQICHKWINQKTPNSIALNLPILHTILISFLTLSLSLNSFYFFAHWAFMVKNVQLNLDFVRRFKTWFQYSFGKWFKGINFVFGHLIRRKPNIRRYGRVCELIAWPGSFTFSNWFGQPGISLSKCI